jgi:hypothetical protein
MRPDVEELFVVAATPNRDVHEAAPGVSAKGEVILCLALLLEKSSRVIMSKRFGKDLGIITDDIDSLLPDNLRPVVLDIPEQQEIIERFIPLIASGETRTPGMLWALGKSLPSVGLKPLLGLLGQFWEHFDHATLGQALLALENHLTAIDGRLFIRIAPEKRANDVQDMLQRIIWSYEGSVEIAKRNLGHVARALGEGDDQ